MTYSIIPLLLILISIGVILAIVIRKFPQVTLLDVDTLPEVKEGKKKDEIIKKRMKKDVERSQKDRQDRLKKMRAQFQQFQGRFRKHVGSVERKVFSRSGAPAMTMTEKVKEETKADEKRIDAVLREGFDAQHAGRLEVAEQKYIEAIRLDKKNVDAYRGLADVYQAQGQTEEAKQTYQFVLQLNADDDKTYVRLGDIAEKEGDMEKAVEQYQQAVLLDDTKPDRFSKLAVLLHKLKQHQAELVALQQAVELEPDNAIYLDKLVEAAILSANKKAADDGYMQLRLLDPDNPKLDILKDKIDSLS